MTSHRRPVLREELGGGYWFDPELGKATELTTAEFGLLSHLARNSGELPRGLSAEEHNAARALASQLVEQSSCALASGLWDSVRVVPLPGDAPRDAAAAPKRIYFEVTRECNLACRSCF
ncbi:MAG: hypothetical protein LBU38_06625, partial [Propionibacteriaceae bacterium]|nr:hypothetical protein [Propionibacteriaceae bacterium]